MAIRRNRMKIQQLLDKMLTINHYRSVTDLQYIPEDNVVFVKRKMGFKDTLINIDEDADEAEVLAHLESVPAIY